MKVLMNCKFCLKKIIKKMKNYYKLWFSLYFYNKLKRNKFNQFQIHLGFEKPTQYYYNDKSKYNYRTKVERKYSDYYDDWHFEDSNLIDSKVFDLQAKYLPPNYGTIKELLVDSKYDNFDELINSKKNSFELYYEIRNLMKKYLKKNVCKDSYGLKNFEITYIIDDVRTDCFYFENIRKNFYSKFAGLLMNFYIVSFIVSALVIYFFTSIDIGYVLMVGLFCFIGLFKLLEFDN